MPRRVVLLATALATVVLAACSSPPMGDAQRPSGHFSIGGFGNRIGGAGDRERGQH